MPINTVHKPITLFASTTVVGITKSTSDAARYGSAFQLAPYDGAPVNALLAQLDVTAGAADAGDALDVAIQTSLDNTNYFDVCAFTQVVGNAAVKRHIAKLDNSLAQATFESSAALTAGNIRNVIGKWLRVKYITTNDADNTVDTSFTFSVVVVPV
jgi:hypothetical protein